VTGGGCRIVAGDALEGAQADEGTGFRELTACVACGLQGDAVEAEGLVPVALAAKEAVRRRRNGCGVARPSVSGSVADRRLEIDALGFHPGDRIHNKKARETGKPSSRAIFAGGGRCWVRTNVG
jgi:hypothetical protein